MPSSRLNNLSAVKLPAGGRLIMAIPYPGRGHIHPMMIFCEHLVSKGKGVRVMFIITEQWLDLLKPEENKGRYDERISFQTIPNVLPSEHGRGSDNNGFLEAVQEKMKEPVEQLLLDMVQTKQQLPDMIVADTCVTWAVELGATRKIRVASLWPLPASSLCIMHHYKLITESELFPLDLSKEGQGRTIHIPGIGPLRLDELPAYFWGSRDKMLSILIEAVSQMYKAQCIIFRTVEEFEKPAIEYLKTIIPHPPIYTIGPAIYYFKTKSASSDPKEKYIEWLNGRSERSALFVSMGSHLSTSDDQLEELAAGLRDSGKPILWVGKEDAPRLSTIIGEKGLLVPWCDQMRVLIHPSVGGFLTHYGCNSVLEAAFAGVPALAFPLSSEQPQNCKTTMENWGIGWRLRKNFYGVVGKEEISETVKSFMDLEGDGRKLLDKNSQTLRKKLLQAVDENGIASDLQGFLSELNLEK